MKATATAGFGYDLIVICNECEIVLFCGVKNIGDNINNSSNKNNNNSIKCVICFVVTVEASSSSDLRLEAANNLNHKSVVKIKT